jgi:[acyl-carrier-protein] S-malonyltransferase
VDAESTLWKETMSTPVVLLFSGQGAQRVGMGADLVAHDPAAKLMLEQAAAALGWPLDKIMLEGPMEELTRTGCCQPALYVHGLMLLQSLRARVPDLEVVAAAGLSLGEFTAHAAVGTFPFAEGLKIVARRGELMDEACAANKGAMVVMIGGEESAIRQLAAECDIDVANLNAPGQIVLSGSESGVDQALARAKEIGVKMAKKLPVAGAYHSRLMQSAQDGLAEALSRLPIQSPPVPVWSNFAASAVSSPEEIREVLLKQVTGSVRWAESIAGIVAGGPKLFLELGPDKALAGMVKRIAPEAEVLSAGTTTELDAMAERLRG